MMKTVELLNARCRLAKLGSFSRPQYAPLRRRRAIFGDAPGFARIMCVYMEQLVDRRRFLGALRAAAAEAAFHSRDQRGPLVLRLANSVSEGPIAWGDSFGFRQVVTRSRDITEPAQLAGLKIRTIQSSIYVKAIELMGASPTPMAFGEVYTSLQTGVIDGYEHDASTTVQQRFYEIAGHMARTRHIAGVLGLWVSTATLARLPADIRAALERPAIEA